jgi:molybdenum-dependent DNA-binding transcriptional regulator ModE
MHSKVWEPLLLVIPLSYENVMVFLKHMEEILPAIFVVVVVVGREGGGSGV